MREIFLQARNISKNFGGVAALSGVDLTIHRGEVLCLAGENGSGKSTLIKVISGVHRADGGELVIEGKRYAHLTPSESIKLGIQVIYQDFSIFPNLTVAENIALNSEIREGRKLVNWKTVRRTALEAMDKIGVRIDPDLQVGRLSVANKQIVAICRALLNDAKLIIMDEPTTALTAREVEHLFQTIKELKARNIAVVIVNHKLEEVYGIAENIAILRGGKSVAEGPIQSFDRARFIQCMTGRSIAEEPYCPDNADAPELFRVENLTLRGAFRDVSFSMRRGDIIGITGLLGSGRSEIGEALFGMLPADSGSIALEGKEIRIRSVSDAIRSGIAYVPEDRLTQGLFLPKSIGLNTVVSSLRSYRKRGVLNRAAMQRDMDRWVEELSINARDTGRAVQTLSGGNQQKVVLAKWINSAPRLLILNQPTMGVDVGSKADIHDILKRLAQSGMGVIIISDDLPELVANCNRVLIMRRGRLEAVCEGDAVREDRIAGLITERAE